MKKIISSCLIFIIPLIYSLGVAAGPNSCVMCHTNETLMKSLYKAPVLPPAEGEG